MSRRRCRRKVQDPGTQEVHGSIIYAGANLNLGSAVNLVGMTCKEPLNFTPK